ncbi:rhamnosyltransferase [Ligilactobacillus sp. WC1T17]|uniref:Rhamnosyltransferase n=2 Tax=Ligilactobacillus TaxID=2767887 RepID=A0ABY1A8X1_9LACO|nr:rhamnosyltransferase [Ligilactobacillus ruminis]
MSTYNGEKYLERQIDSILSQNIAYDIDLIIRDDGSSDETVDILKKYQEENNNIYLILDKNIGVVKSFFALLEYAYKNNYEYYSFSDQDDYWLPNKVSIAINTLMEYDNDYPLLYGNCSKLVDQNLNDLGSVTQTQRREITFYNTAIQNFCPGHAQVINKKLAGIILDRTKSYEQIYVHDLWVTASASVCGKIIFDNEPHTLYTMHQDNELGFGKSRIDWIKQHIQRMQKNEAKKMAIQLQYFAECYSDDLDGEAKKEIANFIDSQKSFMRRVIYALTTKFYRQKSKETFMFKVLYVLGKYNVVKN